MISVGAQRNHCFHSSSLFSPTDLQESPIHRNSVSETRHPMRAQSPSICGSTCGGLVTSLRFLSLTFWTFATSSVQWCEDSLVSEASELLPFNLFSSSDTSYSLFWISDSSSPFSRRDSPSFLLFVIGLVQEIRCILHAAKSSGPVSPRHPRRISAIRSSFTRCLLGVSTQIPNRIRFPGPNL